MFSFRIRPTLTSVQHLLLEKLQTIHEGDASLLDKSLIIYGSPMGDPNVHNHKRCPLVVLGGANGQLAGNIHHKAPAGTPMANVMLTLMHKIGLTDIDQFGDSSGEFSLSADVVASECKTSRVDNARRDGMPQRAITYN